MGQKGQTISLWTPGTTEVESVLGVVSKAQHEFNWHPRTSFAELASEMAEEGIRVAERDAFIKKHEYSVFEDHERSKSQF